MKNDRVLRKKEAANLNKVQTENTVNINFRVRKVDEKLTETKIENMIEDDDFHPKEVAN